MHGTWCVGGCWKDIEVLCKCSEVALACMHLCVSSVVTQGSYSINTLYVDVWGAAIKASGTVTQHAASCIRNPPMLMLWDSSVAIL